MYTATVLDAAEPSTDIRNVTFYRIALLRNGKIVRTVFGVGSHVAPFADLEREAAERNRAAAIFATIP